MPAGITNFQYVGYLGDFLYVYHDIDKLAQTFCLAKSNYDAATRRMIEYKNLFSFQNCAIGFVFFFCGLLLCTSPLLLLRTATLWFWMVLCGILSFVIILTSKILFCKKVLPLHVTHLREEADRAKITCQSAYERLAVQRSNLHTMLEGLPENCSCPLSVYIMREAAKEGKCTNIPQGVRYFCERYNTLASSDDTFSVHLKDNIDKEKDAADARQTFLCELDEIAHTLFED